MDCLLDLPVDYLFHMVFRKWPYLQIWHTQDFDPDPSDFSNVMRNVTRATTFSL